MKQLVYSLVLILILSVSTSAIAQENDEPLIADISYGMTVAETITDFSFFDWWQLEVTLGDKVVISMDAEDGLQPLIGLLDSNGDIVARSDLATVAEVDGTAFLQYDALTEGLHTIIATREGRDQGTTTGSYVLTVTNRNNVEITRPNPFLEAEFRCSEWLLTNALTFEYREDVILPDEIIPGQVTEFYRFSVFGIDGFEPVLRLQSDILMDRPLDCTDSARATEGSQLSLPILESDYVVTEESADNVTMVTLTNSGEGDPLGDVAISVSAKEGTGGRFVLVMEGMEIHDRSDEDAFLIRRGPLASDTILDVYIIGYPNSRMDPILELYDAEADITKFCDDIGTEDCADLLDLTQLAVTVGEDGASYQGDRFDAGIRLDNPENPSEVLTIRSRANTTGNYLVVFVGELPAR